MSSQERGVAKMTMVLGHRVKARALLVFEQLVSFASLERQDLGCFSFGYAGLEGAAAALGSELRSDKIYRIIHHTRAGEQLDYKP